MRSSGTGRPTSPAGRVIAPRLSLRSPNHPTKNRGQELKIKNRGRFSLASSGGGLLRSRTAGYPPSTPPACKTQPGGCRKLKPEAHGHTLRQVESHTDEGFEKLSS